MQEREMVMEKGRLEAAEDVTAIKKMVSKAMAFMGYDVALGSRQVPAIGADTLKRHQIEPPESLKKRYKGPERRKDFHERKRVEEMTPQEMRKELLTDPLTNLSNKRAYQEDRRLPVQVFVDVDSLKWINDNISHEAGDELLRTIGWALSYLDCPGYRPYHFCGDEFVIQAETERIARAALKHALECLDKITFEYLLPDGTTIRKKGAGISYGIGPTVELAEEELQKHKVEREAKGLRAARGETPPGVAGGEGYWRYGQASNGRKCRPAVRKDLIPLKFHDVH